MGMFDVKTVNDVFMMVSNRGSKDVMLWQQGTEWKGISAEVLYGRVRAFAEVLKGWGIQKGDRVAMLSENRWEWAVVDFAALAVGAVDVPLYSTLTAEHVGYMLKDSGARVVVVSTKDQYEKVVEAGELPELEHVVVMEDGAFGNAESFSQLIAGAAGMQARDAAFDAMAAEAKPEELATLIYTSGTTGEPKGVMITHGNLASNMSLSTIPLGFSEKDSCISFLPLSHVMARHLDYTLLAQGARVAYCPKFDQLPAAMKAVKPTIFVGVPRVYEKVRQAVEGKSSASKVKGMMLQWAIATGGKHRQEVLEGKQPGGLGWKLADKLVFSKIKEAFGGCARLWVSGSAPLGPNTSGWFADAGMRIYEGYGLTETSPVIALNYPNAGKMGTVGKPLENVKVRFAADGEIEVTGPSIFPGYWQKEKETKENFTEDGWFKTGDIGKMDEDGFLSITDRKKELLKTSGGKLIAPAPIEGKLKANLLVGQAAMVGDNHKFACVLISPNLPALRDWAKSHGVSAGDDKALVEDAKVKAEYQKIVDEVNKGLSPYETMKRMTVVAEEWTIETGELTPSMKMKRRVVETKYEKEIAEFYKDEANITRD
jgi:long-chain acyl-CoA synthetase